MEENVQEINIACADVTGRMRGTFLSCSTTTTFAILYTALPSPLSTGNVLSEHHERAVPALYLTLMPCIY